MARYPLNLPTALKREAEEWAQKQKVSLNQFIMWAVAEKVGALRQDLDDPNFPNINYRRGTSGVPVPVIRGTGIRIQTIVGAERYWEMSVEDIAEDYDLSKAQVEEALNFYKVHQVEIDSAIAAEESLEPENV